MSTTSQQISDEVDHTIGLSVERALDLHRWIVFELNHLPCPDADPNKRLSISLYGLTITNLRAIAELVHSGLIDSACALARPDFETFVQAVWIRHYASDIDVDRYLHRGLATDLVQLVMQVEEVSGFHGGVMLRLLERATQVTDKFNKGFLCCHDESLSPDLPPQAELARDVLTLAGCLALAALLLLAIGADRVNVADLAFKQLTFQLDAWT